MMKKVLIGMALVIVMLLTTTSFGDLHRINIAPSMVPDETEPRVNFGDAPAGYGPDSWQGPVAGSGNKTNWHARYLADGDYLSALFPADAATMTIADLAEISYYTNRPTGTLAGRDWWVQIYTRTTSSGDNSGWYHDRYINNYGSHTNIGDWTQYSTDSGAMTFQSNGLGGEPAYTLAGLQGEHGSDLIEMISVQTNSGWNGFDGYMDGLEITLTNGNIGQVNFVPVPGAVLLGMLGLSLAGVKLRKHA